MSTRVQRRFVAAHTGAWAATAAELRAHHESWREAVAELDTADLRPGVVIRNRVRPHRLPARSVTAAAAGRVDASRVRNGLVEAGLKLPAGVLGSPAVVVLVVALDLVRGRRRFA